MGDKYYKAMKYLEKHPEKIWSAWNRATSVDKPTPGMILFKGLGNSCAGNSEKATGCLTQVKHSPAYTAPTQLLTDIIRADDSIPNEPSFDTNAIKVEHLPIFVKYQRLADKVNAAKKAAALLATGTV